VKPPTTSPGIAGPRPAAGSPTLEEVYRQHLDRVTRWVGRLGGPELDLEDTVQEVFLVVRARLPEFRGEARLSTWLYEITIRIVQRERRRARWRRWLGGSTEEVAGGIDSGRPTPADELERRQAVERLYRVLDRLGETYRTVFILYELEALPGPEIAELTGLKVQTVWVRLHRARQQFREQVARLERAEASRLDLLGPALERPKEGSR
jgi:RNA polymerase sigma-70 factor (ECF subfamily)